MGKIKYIFILIAVLFLTPCVTAQEVAGRSASLASRESLLHDKNYQNKALQRMVITEVLSKRKSPLVSEVDGFMNACTTHDIDCYLLPSISGLESSFGKHVYPGSFNPFGWGGGYIMFDSWEDGFMDVAAGLKRRYIEKGADTIEKMGPIYAASPTWAVRVRSLHSEFIRIEEEKSVYFTELALSGS